MKVAYEHDWSTVVVLLVVGLFLLFRFEHWAVKLCVAWILVGAGSECELCWAEREPKYRAAFFRFCDKIGF